MATGGGRQLGAQHAHSLEAWYAHVPGIKAVAPATVDDARGLVLAALADPDPVFVFEHATLYPLEGEADETSRPAGLGGAVVRRAGDDVTLAGYGGSLGKTLAAAELLADQGISAEVIDLRVLRPLDIATVLSSLARTHRLVVADEGWRTGGLAGEISAQVMERGFDLLDWPVARVCGAEVPMPYAKHLEDAALPAAERIADAVSAMGLR
jgi:pyruvate dehydrogenase E1 component beta subunit